MPRLLLPNASLEHLKHQAKDLLAAFRSGEPEAQARLRRWFPVETSAPASPRATLATPTGPGAGIAPGLAGAPAPAVAAFDGGDGTPRPAIRLSHAQLALAREYGFPSWPKLAAWVARGEIPGDLDTQVELLGVRSWRVHRAAQDALLAAGAAGVAAAIRGLDHTNARVRRGAADFMDHHADDSCVPKLADLALHDPVPYVRRTAVHAVQCQRCKPAPLTTDVIPLLIRVAREDPNAHVRTSAVYGLGLQPRDARAVDALTATLAEDAHPEVRGAAHDALKRQSPEYRQEAARRARAASVSKREPRSQLAPADQ